VARKTTQLTLLPGDALVAAGMLAYAGPFTANYRQRLETFWRERLLHYQL